MQQAGGDNNALGQIADTIRSLAPTALRESAAFAAIMETLARFGLRRTLDCLMDELRSGSGEKVCPEDLWQVPEMDMEDSGLFDSISNYYSTAELSFDRYTSVIEGYMTWVEHFPLGPSYKAVYREFGFVVFVEFWIRTYSSLGKEARSVLDSPFVQKFWSHHSYMVETLRQVVTGVNPADVEVLRRFLSGWRFRLPITRSQIAFLISHVRGSKSVLLVEAMACRLLPEIVDKAPSEPRANLTRGQGAELSMTARRAMEDLRRVETEREEPGAAHMQRRRALAATIEAGEALASSPQLLPWGLPHEIRDPSAFLSDVVAAVIPEPPNSSTKSASDSLDVIDALIRDRITPATQIAYQRHKVVPRIDGELTDPESIEESYRDLVTKMFPKLQHEQCEAMSQYQAIYPFGISPEARHRRRQQLRSAAVRYTVDGLNKLPSVLSWMFGAGKQPQGRLDASWRLSKVIWEPYTGNCSVAATIWNPSSVSGGNVLGTNILRVYDSVAADVLRAGNTFSGELRKLMVDERGEPLSTAEMASVYDDSYLSRMILQPLRQFQVDDTNEVIGDSALHYYIKHGYFPTPKDLDSYEHREEGLLERSVALHGAGIPQYFLAMAKSSVRQAFAERIGFAAPSSDTVAGEPLSAASVYSALGATPPPNLWDALVPSLRDGDKKVLPWQCEVPPQDSGVRTDAAWLLAGADCDCLVSQRLVTCTTGGTVDIWRFPGLWDRDVVKALERNARTTARRPAADAEEMQDFAEDPNESEAKPQQSRTNVAQRFDHAPSAAAMRLEASLGYGGSVGFGANAVDCARPFGGYVAVGGSDGSVRIYNVQGGKTKVPSRIYGDHCAAVHDIRFHPNGILLASAGADGQILLWDMRVPSSVQRFLGSSHQISSMEFAPNGGLLATVPSCLVDEKKGEGVSLFDLRMTTGVDKLNEIRPGGKEFKLRRAATVTAIDFSKGSQMLTVAYSEGSIVHHYCGYESNTIPERVIVQATVSEIPEDQQVKEGNVKVMRLEEGIVPVGVKYSDANLLHVATTRA